MIADRLTLDRDKRNSKKRCLSSRVVSRFYRPPEIALKEKHYDSKIDMFGIGCVFAEMLH